jgi:tRNA (guanine10-N2)-methyltransferase
MGYGVGRKTRNNIPGLDKIDKYDFYTNFKYYHQPIPDATILDFSTPMLGMQPRAGLIDSIICDPPYGVRAQTKQTGYREGKEGTMPSREEIEKMPSGHIPMKIQYSQGSIYSDLLENASVMLKPKGRLVFLFHTDQTM